MGLTEKSLQKLTDPATFQRGEEYFRVGMVRSVISDGKYIRCEVHGSRRKPYKVTVSFSYGQPTVTCNCQYQFGGICKHGIASLLYLLAHGETGEGVHEGSISPQAAAQPSAAKPRGRDESIRDYLISVYDRPHLRLYLNARTFTVSLGVVWHGKEEKSVDFNSLMDHGQNPADRALPAIVVFSAGQIQLLRLLRGFSSRAQPGKSDQVKLEPFQLNMLLEQAASLSSGVEILDAKSKQPFVLGHDEPLALCIKLRSAQDGRLAVQASLADHHGVVVPFQISQLLPGGRLWLMDAEKFLFRALHPQIDLRFLAFFLDERVLNKIERACFLAGVLGDIKSFARVESDSELAPEVQFMSGHGRPVFSIDVERGDLVLDLSFDYSGSRVIYRPHHEDLYIEANIDGKPVLIQRDLAVEDAAAQELARDYFFVPQGASNRFLITSADDMFGFLTKRLMLLMDRGDVLLSARVRELVHDGRELRPVLRVMGTGIDWFSYNMSFQQGDEAIEIPEDLVLEQLAAGRDFIRLKSGEFIRLDRAAFDRVTGLLADRAQQGRLSLAHLPFMMEELKGAGIKLEADAAAQRLYDELRGFSAVEEVSLPSSLAGVLRDYQRYGVSWMAFLQKFSFGGILADEMGLGKTLQALAVLLRDREAGGGKPSLIVCPTTLVWNWEAEIRKFCPSLKSVVISGQERRSVLEGIDRCDVVITSYALLRRDIDYYSRYQFHYVILDEAQNIKNRHTLSARVTKELHAAYRLALTGTPLENSIADIWSIFDFLMPGFFGSYEKFRQRYESPITLQQRQDLLQELSRLIKPFVLRRVKREVIDELPEKIEQVSYCELEPAQAKLYAAMADKARTEVLDTYRRKGMQQTRMLVLTMIMRLRQICCHPQIAGAALKHKIGVSAKTDLFKEMISELVPSGHRVLVFSQFVGMLEILREYLDKEGIVYEYMDGKTKDRADRVERFNQDHSVKVFLLSLKVGGLGLNLASADTVILYEPWWNPSVEQQAIDRAHRIGQRNPVLAYHLIARGTIEEKILQLQDRKKFLLNSLVFSEEALSRKLGWEDIKFLLDLKTDI